MTSTDENEDRISYLEQVFATDPDRARALCGPSLRIHNWIREAQVVSLEPVGDVEASELPGLPPPKFSTGVERLDNLLGGGSYGFTCIAADPKCGKSLLALSAAIEAAREEWRVLYFDAELDDYERANRIRRYLGTEPSGNLCDQLSFHPTERGITIPHVIRKIEERMSLDDQNLLIVLDSINRIVLQSKKGGTDSWYWATMEEWSEYLRVLSRISGRSIASIAVSETSAGGWAKGRGIEFAADVVIKLKRVDPTDSRYVELVVPHARSSGAGKVGTFHVAWQSGRLDYVSGS